MMEPLALRSEVELVERKPPRVAPQEYKPFQVLDDDLVPAMALAGSDYDFYATGLTHDDMGNPRMDPESAEKLIKRLCNKIQRARSRINDWETHGLEDAELVRLCTMLRQTACESAVLRRMTPRTPRRVKNCVNVSSGVRSRCRLSSVTS